MPIRPPVRLIPHRLTPLAWALLGPLLTGLVAHAQEAAPTPDELRRDLYTLDNHLSLGLVSVSAANRRFGQYRGLADEGVQPVGRLDLVRRDDATGSWQRLQGRVLGRDTGELRALFERQGDWQLRLGASRWAREEPLQVTSGLIGVGTDRQVVSGTAPKRLLDLSVERREAGLTARKFVSRELDVHLSLSAESSTGERMMGRGTPNVIEFLTEPIDRTHVQGQAGIGYAGSRFQWTAAYEASAYHNRVPVLLSSGGNTAASAFGPGFAIALPPSNSAHRWQLAGGYSFDGGSRASFKLSRSDARQDEVFDPAFVRLPTAPTSLHGRVVTDLAFADWVWRPAPDIDLLTQLRWEDREDKTPVERYLPTALPTVGGSFSIAGVTGFNKPRDLTQARALAEAGWRVRPGWRLSAAVEQDDVARNVSETYRRMGMREQTRERHLRVDLKRSGAEQLNGSVALFHSRRSGSDYVPDTYDPNALTNQLGAILWADRERERLRLTLDWVPAEAWSLQGSADVSRDTYSGRPLGVRRGDAQYLALDAGWRPNERWTAGAWISTTRHASRQAQRTDRVGAPAAGYDLLWQADLVTRSQAIGLSLRGQPRSDWQLGADLGLSRDVAGHGLRQLGGASTLAVNSLPTITYRNATLKLFGDWSWRRDRGVRVEALVNHQRNDDWTWQPWAYNGSPSIAASARNSDGSTVVNLPRERLVVLSVQYHVRWR